ncbi:MAG TPA: glycosyltransferase, partial [Nitrososphaera sp.]|nr:glycosyltransferase [Nitrososphaera sp.]
MDVSPQELVVKQDKMPLSVILPTYNESQNISKMLDSIAEALPRNAPAEIIVVDDNSPDGTADIAANHAKNLGIHDKR